jgi:hypothetical protein
MDSRVRKPTSAEIIQKSTRGDWESFIQKGLENLLGRKKNPEKKTKTEERKKMRACENHNEIIVIFNGDVCPLCKAETKLKSIWEEVEKSMGIMKQIKRTAEEAGLKFD